jgi:hypothetical protein
MPLKRVFQHHISVLVERPHHTCPATRARAASRSDGKPRAAAAAPQAG